MNTPPIMAKTDGFLTMLRQVSLLSHVTNNVIDNRDNVTNIKDIAKTAVQN